MKAILAAASRLLHHLSAALLLAGSVIGCGNLLIAVPACPPARPRRSRYRPAAPLTPDEARAWTDIVARLRTASNGNPPSR